jgi:hypothetical protein
MELACAGLRNWVTFAFVSEMPKSKTCRLHDCVLYYHTVGKEHKSQGIQSKVTREIKIGIVENRITRNFITCDYLLIVRKLNKSC